MQLYKLFDNPSCIPPMWFCCFNNPSCFPKCLSFFFHDESKPKENTELREPLMAQVTQNTEQINCIKERLEEATKNTETIEAKVNILRHESAMQRKGLEILWVNKFGPLQDDAPSESESSDSNVI